jgi:hypothetical protein
VLAARLVAGGQACWSRDGDPEPLIGNREAQRWFG